ncbi:hypothetical protein B9T31_07200 [Acinetobacter sp. ANC 4558]|uniref:Fur family transcriptional regulator n=1 Tax=Acinetobacter sp. ANC 4558 TaxID=1977876 RepID=UPI000A35BFBC|nr:transcriptional repressor [Acinetobacter sp. ANC 4558]OTG86769.1 hypothetical protein B9T31_07200 [Acinetobacter sp. ANC 4558]
MTIAIQQNIRKAGLRVTSARVAVMSLLTAQAEDLTVKELYQKLYQQNKKIGLATIYRVIADLEIVGLISQNKLSRGDAKYALPHLVETGVLQIKCADLKHHDQAELVESLQIVFQKFNANLLEIEFMELSQIN